MLLVLRPLSLVPLTGAESVAQPGRADRTCDGPPAPGEDRTEDQEGDTRHRQTVQGGGEPSKLAR